MKKLMILVALLVASCGDGSNAQGSFASEDCTENSLKRGELVKVKGQDSKLTIEHVIYCDGNNNPTRYMVVNEFGQRNALPADLLEKY